VRSGFARKLLLRWPALFVLLFSPDDAELGELGEEVAARELRRRGFRILARRLRTARGEADLLVAAGTLRAIVEVKAGRASRLPRPRGTPERTGIDLRWRPAFRVDARRLARLSRLARDLRADRVDLVEVLLLETGRRFRVTHREDLREAPTGPGLEGSWGEHR
jgi:hypothetical protein